MFFRRKKRTSEIAKPTVGEDGSLYVTEGEEYDRNQYETDSSDDSDSDYSDDGSSSGGEGDDDLIIGDEEEDDEGLTSGEDMSDSKDEKDRRDNKKDNDNENLEKSVNGNANATVTIKEQKEKDEVAALIVAEKKEKEFNSESKTKSKSNAEPNLGSTEAKNLDVDFANVDTPDIATAETEVTTNVTTKLNNDEDDQIALKTKTNQLQQSSASTSASTSTSNNTSNTSTSTTLAEKRSLLSLAAEHDRVDIIKTILKSSAPVTTDTHNMELVQLMLNNRLLLPNDNTNPNPNPNPNPIIYTSDDLEKVFLPPLHLAIASSSTNVASCLLRMGADPSIRPIVPEDWIGPTWRNNLENDDDDDDDDNTAAAGGGKNAMQELEQKWKWMNGMSAWELAFGKHNGKGKETDVQDAQDENKDNDNGDEFNVDQEGGKGRWWFGGSSSSSSKERKDRSNLIISPSKLEGIEHAFTAEALRAIGSDEVDRLKELLDSGFDSNSSSSDDVDVDVDGRSEEGQIQIGGKDLLGWCVEMGATRCGDMLRTKYNRHSSLDSDSVPAPPSADDHDDGIDQHDILQNKSNINEKEETDSQTPIVQEADNTTPITEEETIAGKATIRELQIKLEETESLSSALSIMLDNLAEEVSLLQAILFQNNDQSSNLTLLSQIRTLKEQRSSKDQELSFWEQELADREAELQMVLMWWERRGGTVEDLPSLDHTPTTEDIATRSSGANGNRPPPSPLVNVDELDQKDVRRRVSEMKAQLALSENKVEKLRSSMSSMAEESARSMEKVETMGLVGAVKLCRTLKEEVRERYFALQNAKSVEAEFRARIGIVRDRLERKSEEPVQQNGHVNASSAAAEGDIVEDGSGDSNQESVTNMTTEAEDITESQNAASNVQQDEETSANANEDASNDVDAEIPQQEEEEEEGRIENNDSNSANVEVNTNLDNVEEQLEEAVGNNDSTDVESPSNVIDSVEHKSSEEDYFIIVDEINDIITPSELITHSQARATGKSTAIVERLEGGHKSFLSFKIWDLIMRIVGLGKQSMQKAVQDTVGRGDAQDPRVMIV